MENANINPELIGQLQSRFDELKQMIESDDFDYEKIEDDMGLDLKELEDEIFSSARMQKIEIETIHPDAVFPSYAYPSDSGFDLHSTEDLEIGPFGRILVPTGIKVSFGDMFEIQVRPKSGLAIKQGLTVLNTPGTVDSGYNGEIKVIVFNTNNYSVVIPKGMKVAQAVLCPVIIGKYVNLVHVNQIGDKDRGNNGFGSTGI
jgi:dUTP pyrophosphatase